jgi:bifunctional DNA-binding transcriptional regulator/antitoxin component of YhaV-PrlF toxin-antitoxin module
MKRKIIRVGSSRGVLIPREVTRAMGWEFGSMTELTVDEDNNQLIIETAETDIPDELDKDQLKEFEKLAKKHKKLLEGLDD